MPTTRLIFFALLLGNVIFFAWRQNAGPAEGHEPQRLQQQLNPEKIRLILPDKPASAVPAEIEAAPTETTTVEPTTSTTPAPDTPPAVEPSPKASEPAAKSSSQNKTDTNAKADSATGPTLLCKSFNGLTPETAKAAQSAINSSAPNTKVTLISVKEPASYWVHIPPQSNKAGADKKVVELKELGVNDSFIISDEGPSRWAVSLGLFRSKDMADNYLQKLSKQGVRSAKIEVRDKGTDKARLEVSAPAEALGVLAREIKPLANATLGDCKTPEVAKN